ncbi:serine/threonine-protein kinase [Spirillospora sp. NPDC047279]|uniref:serine/threonine-protein kinase n=1 Tax=Spirillospora sp. NPDC047279 TaxID=3155478 RepID=UPI0033DA98C6
MEQLGPEDPPRIGRYRLVARLGQGGMGQVFLALSPAGAPVALKVIHPHYAADPRFRSRFEREVANARRVSGAFTAPVIDADPTAAAPWLVTAYLPGMALSEAVKTQGPFPLPAVYSLAAGIAEGLQSVHRAGVVHRDLKPANVLLGQDGPRIIDFGIARAAEESGLTRPGAVLGSPGYMSPEQAAGQPLDAASDVFSLGAVIVFCATGEGPFGRGPVAELIRRATTEPPRLDGIGEGFLRDLVAGCMQRDPRQRPLTWQILETLHRHAASPEGVGWMPPRLAAAIRARDEPVEPPVDRRRLLLGTAAAVTAAAAGGIAAVRVTGKIAETGERAAFATTAPTRAVPSATGTRPPGAFASPAPAPREVWRRPMPMYGWMAAAPGRVFAADTRELTAFDARTGTPRWRVARRAVQRPVVVGDLAVVGERSGHLLAVDLASGRERWRHARSGVGFSDLLVAGGNVCFAAFNTELDRLTLIGLDPRTGAERWRAEPLTSDETTFSHLAVAGGHIAVAFGDALHLVDARDGRRSWRAPMRGARLCGADAGTVYAVGGGQLHAVRDGKDAWAVAVGADIVRGVLVADTLVLSESGALTAMAKADGRFRWELRDNSPTARSWDLLVPGTRHVFVTATGSGDLTAVDTATGAIRWRHTVKGRNPRHSDAVEADGTVYVSSTADSSDGRSRLHALALPQ